MRITRIIAANASLAVILSCATLSAQERKGSRVLPDVDKPDQSILQRLDRPSGFEINFFADGLGNPRMMEVAQDGTVFVTVPDRGEVVALKDTNGDGRSDEKRIIASGLSRVHGITIHNGTMYLAGGKQLHRTKLKNDNTLESKPEEIISDLPHGKSHDNRTLAVGADGLLYITIGSSCNDCVEENKEHAAILRAKLDGSSRETFATGLRNTIGFGWHPETGEMWGMDHGSDWRGNDLPPEELNLLKEGANYGWPFCYGKQQVDEVTKDSPPDASKEQFCAKTEPMVLGYQAHSAPIGFVFYTEDQFPAEYRNDAFVVFRGSWNRKPPAPPKIVRLKFENGQPREFEDFVTGFQTEDGSKRYGRLAGAAVAKDGSLLVSDDSNGIIYRIAYTGGKSGRSGEPGDGGQNATTNED